MSKSEITSSLKTFKNRYRLVIMNDDTFEEVVTFRLSRSSVYITLSAVFVLLVGLTVALLVLTPLKYYIPGYAKKESSREMQVLKMKTDSLQNVVLDRQRYFDDLKKVLNGNTPSKRDTAALKITRPKYSAD